MLEILIPKAAPPWSQRGKKLESMIRKALYEHGMLAEVPKLAIALSGGKDSLTLLFMLKAILGRGFPSPELYPIHVQGEFSCGPSIQENFLRAICQELDLPLLIRESTQKREDLECYSCSRERRRLIFEAALSVGATTIAFGHHRDDHAQTILLNLFHKGEFAGNLPKIEMVDYGVTLIRPLIYCPEGEILRFAQENRFAKVTCQCPVGQHSMRKRVDHLIDQIEAFFPNARTNIAQAGLIYGSDKARRKHDKSQRS
jgi:tRNA 2-thiocytidine biosynthesis protein TtcA